jgi:hypothetical protein
MKKTYFEAPALEVVKMQTMQMICGSSIDLGGDNQESDSKAYQWSVLEDDTEEEE